MTTISFFFPFTEVFPYEISFVERVLPILSYSVLYSMHEINIGFDVLSLWFIPNVNDYVVTISLCPSRSRLEMKL